MSKSRSPFGRRADRTGSVEVFVRPEQSIVVRILAVLWQLRAELVASALGFWVWRWLTDRMATWAAVAVLVIAVVGLMAWSPSRRFVVGHVWCTVTRHRLRSCMVQSRVMNHRGYVPWCLWVRPTKVGERVWLLMRAGTSVEELNSRTAQIAAACWARDSRVRAWRRLVAVVTVDVVRRDPLTTGKLVGSPLPEMAGDGVPAGLAPVRLRAVDEEQVAGVGRDADEVEDWELGPDASGAVLADPKPARRRTPVGVGVAKPAEPVSRPAGSAVVSSSGEDVSDYV